MTVDKVLEVLAYAFVWLGGFLIGFGVGSW